MPKKGPLSLFQLLFRVENDSKWMAEWVCEIERGFKLPHICGSFNKPKDKINYLNTLSNTETCEKVNSYDSGLEKKPYTMLFTIYLFYNKILKNRKIYTIK